VIKSAVALDHLSLSSINSSIERISKSDAFNFLNEVLNLCNQASGSSNFTPTSISLTFSRLSIESRLLYLSTFMTDWGGSAFNSRFSTLFFTTQQFLDTGSCSNHLLKASELLS